MPPEFLETLNDQQRDAVTAPDGALLVLAGAGSGKTRVIVARIAYLIAERGVSPDAILAVTFTNKAADEMRRRVDELLGGPARELSLHTFHALCLRLLRRFGDDVGLRSGFTLYAEDDRRSLLRRLIREAGLLEREFPVSRVGGVVSKVKHAAFTEGSAPWDPWSRRVTAIAERYQQEMDAVGAVDFDDLLLKGVELLECSERARSFAAQRFRHVLVDEYQDTNRVQYRLLRLLAPHGNVFVVGDEDQSIYNFRGADLRNILDFERDFSTARLVKLEVNYRSTGSILRAAGAVIANNKERKGKRLRASLEEGEPPKLFAAEDERDEAAFVALTLTELRKEQPAPRCAVLLRTHAQTRILEEELVNRGIPHQVVGGFRFYERREIRDTLAYLRLMVNRHDDRSLIRVVNVPGRGVGAATTETLQRRASESNRSLWDAVDDLLDDDALSGRPRLGLMAFRELISALGANTTTRIPSRAISLVLQKSGILQGIEREGEAAARDRKENLDQLVSAAVEYESREDAPTLEGFIDSVSLLSDIDSVAGLAPCLLMTLHAAKGLEFDVVFLAGLEEGLFPHIRSTGDAKATEEERRLFYVGITRAKRKLFLSFALTRRFSYQTSTRRASRFLAEIPDELLHGERAKAAAPETRDETRSGLRPGMLVQHAKFGEGRVVEASGRGRDRKVTVVFRRAGRKRLVEAFAKLEVVGHP